MDSASYQDMHPARRSSSEILQMQLPSCLIEGASGTSSKRGSDIRVTIEEVLHKGLSKHELKSKNSDHLTLPDAVDDPNRVVQVQVVEGGILKDAARCDIDSTHGSESAECSNTSGESPAASEGDNKLSEETNASVEGGNHNFLRAAGGTSRWRNVLRLPKLRDFENEQESDSKPP